MPIRPSDTKLTVATIGTGNGHAARGQVVSSDGRIAPSPGPGWGSEAEPMAGRRDLGRLTAASTLWGRVCGCTYC